MCFRSQVVTKSRLWSLSFLALSGVTFTVVTLRKIRPAISREHLRPCKLSIVISVWGSFYLIILIGLISDAFYKMPFIASHTFYNNRMHTMKCTSKLLFSIFLVLEQTLIHPVFAEHWIWVKCYSRWLALGGKEGSKQGREGERERRRKKGKP